MKTRILTLLLALSIVFGAGKAMAGPLTIEAFSNPDYATIFDVGSGYSTIDVDYIMNVVAGPPGFGVNYVELSFEEDVFSSINSISVASPGSWSILGSYSAGGVTFEMSGGPSGDLEVGDSLMIASNVTILHDAIYNASGSGFSWNEGGAWQQSIGGTSVPGGFVAGSTSPVPEPGTMILLGSGLVGLAFYGRRRKKAQMA